MNKYILCNLPLPIKIGLGKIKTNINKNKTRAIKEIHEKYEPIFQGINSPEYKKNLIDYLYSCAFTAEETKDYINYLYNDKIELINNVELDYSKPTIICVVKNEADKLGNFFRHYNKIGKFNYIFIDNLSTDSSIELMRSNNAKIYQCTEKFSTNRKISWINKVYSTIPNGSWTILLDADELLVYHDYETVSANEVISYLDEKKIKTAGAIMIDMFSTEMTEKDQYLEKYIYFENLFHEEKSYYFNSVYGGIRERVFKYGNERIFLIKKHPIVKKESNTMLIHCHYIYPFKRNIDSQINFGLLHYKLFDNEIEKYRNIANSGNYGAGSIEYKTYMQAFSKKSYDEIFSISEYTERYQGTSSLEKIDCIKKIGEIL